MQKVYPQYANINSGFKYDLDTKGLAEGEHVLGIMEIGNSGGTSVFETKITVGKYLKGY